MPFLEKISVCFLDSLDTEAVASWLLDDGIRREQAEKEAPPAGKKAPIQNWSPARWNPSLN